MLATVSGLATRWVFCLLTSVILMNSDSISRETFNFALVGVLVYVLAAVLPEIIEGQVYVQ